MLAHGAGLCYIEGAFHAFYKEALGLTKLSARERARIGLLALIIAAAALFFCSKSSPAYPINDWSDANIYFSAGKGMLAGRVMYRDLYDHKGPLIYALHALCALVCPADFTGVWVLEILFAAVFLLEGYRAVKAMAGRRAALLSIPLTALCVYTSYCFQAGDSAEELALPMILLVQLHWLESLKSEKPVSFGRLLGDGFLFGCVFWMKFTLCGTQGMALLLGCLLAAQRNGAKGFFRSLGGLLLGFLLSALPWLLYFGLNGALADWLKTYLYDNLFLYSSGEGGLLWRAKQMLKSGWEWLSRSPLCALPVCAGVIASCFGRGKTGWQRIGWLLPFLLGALGVFIGGKTYPYYPLALAAFLPCFFGWLGALLEKRLAGLSKRAYPLLAAALCGLCVLLCPVFSPNVKESFGLPREETMQYQFAAKIAETPGATLLNYGFMDAGFYTAAQITPNVKYYHQTNVPLQEMLDEQVRYIRDGVCDYVVTRGRQPEDILKTYDLIAAAETPEGFWYDEVYLYRKKGLIGEEKDRS